LPLELAMTQNNLADALQRSVAQEDGTGRLNEAVAAYPRRSRNARGNAGRPTGREHRQPRRRANAAFRHGAATLGLAATAVSQSSRPLQ